MIDLPENAHDLNFRQVSIDDLDLLRSWDESPHAIAAGVNDWDWETDLVRFPDWRLQLIVEMQGKALAFLQIIDPFMEDSKYWHPIPPNYRAIDIWIGPSQNLNRGLGSKIMKQAIESCFLNKKVKAIVIDPLKRNTRAIRFYKRLGFVFLEDRIMQNEEIEVLILNRQRHKKLSKKILTNRPPGDNQFP